MVQHPVTTQTLPRPLPDLSGLANDPKRFQEAHKKYGGYLKEGGLPFEPEELEDDEDGTNAQTHAAEPGASDEV